MKRLALAAAIGAVTAGAAWSQADAPQRAAGLWTFHLVYDDGSYPIPDSQICIDPAAEQRLTIVGAQMDRTKCDGYALTPTGAGTWAVRSVCTLASKAQVETTGTVKGDLSRAYVIDSAAVTSGAGNPMQNGTHHLTVTAQRIGPCPTGQAGGDMTTNGKTANVLTPK